MNTTLTQFDIKNATGLRKLQADLTNKYRDSLLQETKHNFTFAERFLPFLYNTGVRLWVSLFVVPLIVAFIVATLAAPSGADYGNVFVVSFVLSAALMVIQVMGLDSAFRTRDFAQDEASRLARLDVEERLTRNFANSTYGVPTNMKEVMDNIEYGNTRKVIVYRFAGTDLVQVAL